MGLVALDGTFLRVNEKLCQILGYKRSELEGRTFASITHKEDQGNGLDLRGVLEATEGAAVSFEKRYIAKSGQVIWVRVTTTLTLTPDKKPLHFTSLFEDITDDKNFEKEISDQKIRVIAASKINGVGRMAAGMAHEINNPLTIVMGQASRIKKMAYDGKINSEQLFSMAEQIETMASRIADIISGLRSFAREGSDEPIVRTSLGQILNDALKFCRTRIILAGIDLRVQGPTQELFLNCRGVQLTQALLNIINNAKDALDGKKKGIIEVKIFSEARKIGYEIHDNGDGVSEDRLSFLFQPFFTTKPVGLGTGLGLSITKDIVEKYDGQISYSQSHLGGACFRIEFKC